ncbi:unnamed protein product, partial [Prorocentrum cordatum]
HLTSWTSSLASWSPGLSASPLQGACGARWALPWAKGALTARCPAWARSARA